MRLDVEPIRDLLSEAIRYAKSDRIESRALAYDAANAVIVAGTQESEETRVRLFMNIEAAREMLVVDPDAAIGYWRGVRHELQLGEGRL